MGIVGGGCDTVLLNFVNDGRQKVLTDNFGIFFNTDLINSRCILYGLNLDRSAAGEKDDKRK